MRDDRGPRSGSNARLFSGGGYRGVGLSFRAVRFRGEEMNRKERRLFQSATRNLTWEKTVQIAAEVAGKMVNPDQSGFEKRLSDEIIGGLVGQPFYHGGLPGRQVGDYLLPARVTEEDPREGRALIRTIFAALLYEISLVVVPAYKETEVEERNWTLSPGGVILPDGPDAGLRRTLNRWRV